MLPTTLEDSVPVSGSDKELIMRFAIIIPAAGASTRFGAGDKLGQDFGGRPLLLRSIEPFAKRDDVHAVIVAGPPDELETFQDRYGAQLSFLGGQIVAGGRLERWETVRNALEAVPSGCTHVAIHDGARPLVDEMLIDRVFEAAKTFPAVVPGVPVRDTLKRGGTELVEAAERDATVDSILGLDDGDFAAGGILGSEPSIGHQVSARRIEGTIDRTNLWRMQTPQVFEIELLRRAYAQPDLAGATDDAMLIQRLGEPVMMVEGSERNLKVTTMDDLVIARAISGIKEPEGRPAHKRF
jgi:2-C-methyl-D-erythritol 4-phosphate cytidylyltransferase